MNSESQIVRIVKFALGVGLAMCAVLVIRDAPHEIDRAYTNGNGTVVSAVILFAVALFLSIVPSFLLLRSALKGSPSDRP